MVSYIITFLLGALVGVLVARNNIKKVNALVDEAKELAEKAEKELAELKAKTKKPRGNSRKRK
jgi:F0F1-type ATP synthase membrane subunit b/b'